MRVDFVAPPFAGHLFPLLQLARSLRSLPGIDTRVLTTASGLKGVEVSDLAAIELLPGRGHVIADIANTSRKVGSNPLRMIEQLKLNLSLMTQLRGELLTHWDEHRPDLVIADFVVPVAGLTAQEIGIEWWTGMPTPCVLETGDGVPSYLGGWMPRGGLYGGVRDFLGRRTIRLFKRTVHRIFASDFRRLSIPSVYRDDGSEIVYSPAKILGFGIEEFEFNRSWPDHFEFIGPLTAAPPYPHTKPNYQQGKRHVLVTLGTHLPWARDPALDLIREVAARMPDWVFHFTDGEPGSVAISTLDNVSRLGFLPYNEALPQYDAAIIHGGTGITYACLEAGVPMLVWPHDYDQFDHASRVVHRGLGLRLIPKAEAIERDLRRLASDPGVSNKLALFQRQLGCTTAESRFRKLLDTQLLG